MSNRDYIDPSKINPDEIPDFEEDIPEDDPYKDGKEFDRQWGKLQDRQQKEDGDYTPSDGY